MNTDLRPITLEYIKELRLSGQSGTASELLAAYYASSIKERKQNKKELLRDESKKRIMVKKHYGVCTHFSCNADALPNRRSCQIHLLMHRELNKKNLLLKKQKDKAPDIV